MKAKRFVAGQLWIERCRRREGPEITYTVLSGRSSRLFTDHKMMLRHIKWPKGTPTGDALREWLESFEQKPEVIESKMAIQSGGQSLPAVQALPHQAVQA